MKIKRVTLVLNYTFEIKDGCITWVGGSEHYQNEKGKQIGFPKGVPSTHNLLIHVLGKSIEGTNGDNQLAIVNNLENNAR